MKKLIDILKRGEMNGETDLYTPLEDIKNEGRDSWLNQLHAKWDSYNGLPHFQNVELYINQMLPKIIEDAIKTHHIDQIGPVFP